VYHDSHSHYLCGQFAADSVGMVATGSSKLKGQRISSIRHPPPAPSVTVQIKITGWILGQLDRSPFLVFFLRLSIDLQEVKEKKIYLAYMAPSICFWPYFLHWYPSRSGTDVITTDVAAPLIILCRCLLFFLLQRPIHQSACKSKKPSAGIYS